MNALVFCTTILAVHSIRFQQLKSPKDLLDLETSSGREDRLSTLRNIFLNSLRSTEDETLLYKTDRKEATHLCITATNPGPIGEMRMFFRSLQRHSTKKRKYVINYITDDDSEKGILKAIREFGFSKGQGTIFNDTKLMQALDDMKIIFRHHSGIAGIAKIFVLESFSKVDRCITVDTDLFAVKPLHELYLSMQNFNDEEVIGATWRPSYPWGDRFNAGVMLYDFQKMRKLGWNDAMANMFAAGKVGGSEYNATSQRLILHWPEQEILHAALLTLHSELDPFKKPRGLNEMDKQWNMEMCRRFYNGMQNGFEGMCKRDFSLIHFNCLGDNGHPWWTDAQRYPEAKKGLQQCQIENLP